MNKIKKLSDGEYYITNTKNNSPIFIIRQDRKQGRVFVGHLMSVPELIGKRVMFKVEVV